MSGERHILDGEKEDGKEEKAEERTMRALHSGQSMKANEITAVGQPSVWFYLARGQPDTHAHTRQKSKESVGPYQLFLDAVEVEHVPARERDAGLGAKALDPADVAVIILSCGWSHSPAHVRDQRKDRQRKGFTRGRPWSAYLPERSPGGGNASTPGDIVVVVVVSGRALRG